MRTRFFTGQGDGGESAVSGKKISKSSALAELLGGLDELNSWLGFCKVEAERFGGRRGAVGKRKSRVTKEREINLIAVLKFIQETLFIIQAEVAALGFGYPNSPKIGDEKTKYLEEIILEIDAAVPKIEKFIIPGGSELAARLDVARTISRRVERLAKKYGDEKPLSPPLMRFLNRASSLLFALARYVNFKFGIQEENPSYK
jgi:cob(I)alamin adenosyltransferase